MSTLRNQLALKWASELWAISLFLSSGLANVLLFLNYVGTDCLAEADFTIPDCPGFVPVVFVSSGILFLLLFTRFPRRNGRWGGWLSAIGRGGILGVLAGGLTFQISLIAMSLCLVLGPNGAGAVASIVPALRASYHLLQLFGTGVLIVMVPLMFAVGAVLAILGVLFGRWQDQDRDLLRVRLLAISSLSCAAVSLTVSMIGVLSAALAICGLALGSSALFRAGAARWDVRALLIVGLLTNMVSGGIVIIPHFLFQLIGISVSGLCILSQGGW